VLADGVRFVFAVRPCESPRTTMVGGAQSRRHALPPFGDNSGDGELEVRTAPVLGLQQQLEVSAQDIVQARSNALSASARSAGNSQTSRAKTTAATAERRLGR
jgi:hypothetical protein